ncbi:hypothetical protein GIB67_008981, partial [Kingdonia uniflora]
NCDEAGVGVAAAQDEEGAGRVHRVSSHADFSKFWVLKDPTPSSAAKDAQEITPSLESQGIQGYRCFFTIGRMVYVWYYWSGPETIRVIILYSIKGDAW